MNGEIITVGSEILIGDIVNTHSQFLSKEMAKYGINILFHTSVGDNEKRLKEITRLALSRSDFLIITGGLGPTQDDLTRETVANELKVELQKDESIAKDIENYYKKLQRQMPDSNYRQAMVPKGSRVLKNKNGTAPGLIIEKNSKIVILLPGPPSELIPMYNEYIKDYLKDLTGEVIHSHNINFFNIGESNVDEKLGDLLNGTNPTIGTYAKDNEVRVRITAKGSSKQECENLMEPLIEEIKNRLNDYIYGIDVSSIEEAIKNLATGKGIKIATAESCTGGMIAQAITSVSGSSEFFEGTVVSYSNDVKKNVLKIKEQTLKKYGAVSEQTAKEMALGARNLLNADIAVSTTGIAGPTGGTKEKPVGLVYLGVSTKDKTIAIKLNLSKGIEKERESIRQRATLNALFEIFKILKN